MLFLRKHGPRRNSRPGWVRATIRAWQPFGRRPHLMTRGRYLLGLAVLVFVSMPLNLVCMYSGSAVSEAVLLLWTLSTLTLMFPATLERATMAGLPRWLAAVAMALVLFACAFSAMVPLVAMRADLLRTYASVFTAGVVWCVCILPLLALGCRRDRPGL